MRVLICGGRDFMGPHLAIRELDVLRAARDVIVVSGCAPGADTLSR